MLSSPDDMTEAQQDRLKEIVGHFEASERLHKQHRDHWNRNYGLYRNYRKFKSARSAATNQNDRDEVMAELVREYGAELFIPYVYSVIETIVPRILSNDPKMLALPLDLKAKDHVRPVQKLFERDQSAINYEIKLQATARRGLMFGLGVQKTYWEKKTRKGRKVSKGILRGNKVEDATLTIREGPQAEDVDPFDWFWSPAAKDIETCEYVFHRTWRTMRYIAAKVKSGEWAELDLEKVKGMASNTARGDLWADRMQAAGIVGFDPRGNDLHEVWEYHDRESVVTVLDKTLIVQEDRNPHFHGDLPFQVYRPTIVPGEMVGMSEVEPIAHLQYELNTMRSQRRDAATLALNRGYFFSDGMLDPNDAVTGPGMFVPVLGDPREAIFPMPIQDIPASSVSEEEALKADIERTTGIGDPITGAEGQTANTQTATGVQLVQAAANFRIRQKAKNLSTETIRDAACQWLYLYRQHLLQPVSVRVPSTGSPDGYEFDQVGPEDVNANIEILPEGGSTEPDNVPQKRADAIQLFQSLAASQDIDQRKAATYLLEQFDVTNPEDWFVPPGPDAGQAVEAVGQVLAQYGVNHDLILQVIQEAQQQLAQQPPQLPPPAENRPGSTPPAPEQGPASTPTSDQ